MSWNYSDNEFIKIFRKMLNWEWYTDVNTKTLFIHCLLKANWKPGSWHGHQYDRGQFITSLPSLAKETGLSVQQVRTALKHLKSTGELTDKKYPKFRIITVVSFDKFQSINRQTNSKPTAKSTVSQQATNRQSTADIRTYKNSKNIKKKEGESTFDPDDYVYDFATTDVDDDDW
jgi:DNA-binding transcriptional regulator YhcF (GntR family)